MNIFDSIGLVASEYPERVALVAGNQALSYRALLLATSGVAQRFLDAGISAHDVVMLRSTDPMAGLVLTLALARLGAVSVAVSAGVSVGDLFQRCGVKVYVAAQACDARDGTPQTARFLSEALLLAPVPQSPNAFQTATVADSTAWRIALSSGTTGRSKAMLWTHAASLAAWQSTVEPFSPLAVSDRVLVFQDIAGVFAIHRIVRILSRGATLVLPSSPSPLEFARCVDLYGVTQAITVTALAIHLYRHLVHASDKPGLRFPGLTRMIVGGEPLSAALREGLRSRVCPHLVMTYGTSESGPIATADVALLKAHPRATGRLLSTTQVQVLDPLGMELPRGQLGMLRVRTPGMVDSYLANPDLSARAFHEGWYETGDLGAVDEQGVVTLGARKDEWLDLDGQPVDPLTLEAVIGEMSGVQEVVVFLAHHLRPIQAQLELQPRPILAALYTASSALEAELVRKHCAKRLPALQVPQFVGQVQELPRTANGKISRRDLGQRFKFEPAATASVGAAGATGA